MSHRPTRWFVPFSYNVVHNVISPLLSRRDATTNITRPLRVFCPFVWRCFQSEIDRRKSAQKERKIHEEKQQKYHRHKSARTMADWYLTGTCTAKRHGLKFRLHQRIVFEDDRKRHDCYTPTMFTSKQDAKLFSEELKESFQLQYKGAHRIYLNTRGLGYLSRR